MAHTHSHGDHDHGSNESRLFWTALITGSFMLVEAAGGLFAGSLALLADAGHMLTDFAGLTLAWLAFRVSRWPADRRRTYGFERMQVLVAFGNGLVLFFIAGAIIVEAAHRLMEPAPVLGGPMLVIAIIGLAVNIGMFFVLHGADRENLNVRGAMVHVLGDLFGSAGAIAAALVILTTGWTQADPLISVLVAVIILRSAWYVVRDSAHILLEGTPNDLSLADVEADLQAAIPDVEDVHHVHAWSITQERPMVTLHARICDTADADRTVVAIKERLRARFGVSHATVEIERSECADSHLAAGPQHHHEHSH
jgi:cobalt-zinc-cadmium efflux system protein